MKGFILLLVFFAGSPGLRAVRAAIQAPASAGAARGQELPSLPVSRHRFVVIAHRGDHEHAPENTVAAVRDAIRCGVDYVELDLRTTRDGYLVLSHDVSVDRMTGGHGKIADLTLAEIKGLVIHRQAGGEVYRVPEFREVLAACEGRINIYLDFKQADVAETWRQIRAAGMEKHVVVYLNKPEQYGEWRAVAPQMPLMASLPDRVQTREEIDSFLAQHTIGVLDNVYDTAMQRLVRQKGIVLWLDAESDKEGPADWDRLLAGHIQGMQTDHPEELMDYLRRAGVVKRNAGVEEGQSRADAGGYFNIKDFGAMGDGQALDSKAINAAIVAAADAGGGTVYVPAGNYLCGSIRLKSNIHLLIDQGATLVAAEVKPENDYDEEEAGSSNAYQDKGHSHWHNSLIWGEGLHDVSITGSGLIWGKGLYRSGVESKQTANKAIALLRCRNVTLRDFSILHGGWFAILATGTDNLTVDNLRMDTNRDGIDVDACRNVRISNCLVNSPYDDGICLKSSYALDSARSTENVTITNCQVSGYDEGTLLDGTFRRTKNPKYGLSPTGRIKLGTESNGGFRNITISNCVFDYCKGLALETVDGALLEDVTITNITMRDVKEPIFLRLGARMRGPAGVAPGALRRIDISHIVAYNAAGGNTCTISGIPGHPIEDIQLSDIRVYYQGGGLDTLHGKVPENEKKYPEPGMFGPSPVYGLYVRHVKHIALTDVYFSYGLPDHRSPLAFDDVSGIYMRHVEAQKESGLRAVLLKGVAGFTISDGAGQAR